MRKKSIFDCLIYPFFVILLIHSTNGFTILPNPFNGQFIQQILMANTQQNTNFENPTNFAFLPDGRILVSEKLGKVKIITTSGSLDPQPWIDISNKVTSSGDRGLLGMAVHPDFQNNKYVYLLYSQRQVEGGTIESGEQAVQGRLVRYTEVDGYASMASEKVLIGATWGSGFPDCFDSHHVGTIHFGNDGSLLVSSGEGSHWDRPDWGQDTTAFDYQCAQLFGQDQDVGAFRAQMLDSLGGKVVRLDPETGLGIGTSDSKGRVANPFYDASAPASPKSLVWMYGLRNPFKFTVRMDTNVNNGHPGTLYIGDVGWDLWEETHVASEAGTNLGWPCYQGPVLETRYSGSATAGVGATFCDSRLGQISNEGKNPTMFWHHLSTNPAGYNIGFIGNCAAGAAVYTGTTYPSQFQGNSTRRAVFFADYGANWIKIFWVDQNDAILDNSVQEFADSLGNLVAIHPHPTTGELYYLSISPAALGKFIYSEDGAEVSNLPPNCMAAASVVAGPAPLSVQFSSDNSYDLQNKEIRFDWNFGDGSKSTLANPSHVFTQSGSFNVTLTVTNVNMVASSCSVTVRTDKLPPAATILTPAPFYVFAPGETVTFTSSATDADSTQSQLTFQWEVILVHNNHKHSDIFKANGTTFSAVLSSFLSPDERNCLEIVLTVTDESGLKDQKMIRSLQRGYVNTAPRPGMKITPQVGRAKMTLTATDNSADTEQDWLDCTWQFGDGFNATGLLVRHTYETAGQYVIFHNCQDAYGLWGVLTALPISVSQGKVSMRITPAGGVYSDSVTAQMASIIDGATIRYTVDGTDPTSTSQLYTGPLQLTKATYPTGVTLKAIAFANGRDPSDIYSQRYRFGTLPLVGPIAFLTFEEMSPLSIEDCSANFINITSLGVNQNAAGKYGNAADFGSSNSSIQLQLGTTTITQLTATMWIKAAAFSQMATLLTIGDVNLQYFPSNAQLVLSNGNGGDFCIGTATLTPNTWHSIGVVVNATTCDLIIDGTSSTVDGKLTSPISQNVGSPVTAWIGSSAAGVGFSGMIDQFSLYNQSLSADSIEMVLSNIVFPNSPPRVQFLPHILTATVGKETIIASQVKDDCQPANRTLTFDWSQTSGPGTAVLGDSPSNSPTARKVTFPQAGTYVIQLSVSDGTASSTGSVTVIVGTSNAALGPTVTPCGGYYPQSGTNTLNSNVQVSMAAVSGAQIYFSIDGSDPSVLYNTPFAVGNSLTLRAVTVFANSTRSEETKCTFQFEDIQASLLLHYDMEFFSTTPSPITAGGIIDDTSSAQNDGNVTGSVSASSTQGSGIRILGNYAASLGEQDRIEAQIPAGLNFTAACWMQLASLDQLPATLFSFDKTSTSDPTGWSVVLYSNSLAFLGSSNDKAAFEFFPDTQWTHIAVSLVNGQDVTLFVDGQALGEITQLDHMVTPATGNGAMILGGITGLVDEFMIFSTGSNSEKIRYIMENGAAIIDVGTTTDGSGRGSTTSTDIFDSSSSRIVGEILVTALILVLSWQVW